VAEGRDADDLFREALDRLSRTPTTSHLARAHLLYGEWLRGEHRRLDAGEQLRERARDVHVDGGEGLRGPSRTRTARHRWARASKPRVETRSRLTAQEAQIARLANAGLSNREIGVRLFLSPRTVEYHLLEVFTKLGIGSRTELESVLPDVVGEAVQTGRRRP
jgi:DNA-binding CsgD family transcriptional regulator